jgi:hypothetical protein
MSIIKHLQEEVPFELRAKQEASAAAMAAQQGTEDKKKYIVHADTVSKWRGLMVNAPVTLHNILFVIFVVVEILLSYEVYRSILQDIGFPNQIITLGVLIVAFLVSGWAAATAHLIGKGWSKEVQEWERWNYVFLTTKNTLSPLAVDGYLFSEIKRARRLAITSGIVLFVLVGLSVAYRTIAIRGLAEADGEIGLMQLVILAALPILILIGELYTGDFIWYSMSLSRQKRLLKRYYKSFMAWKKACNNKDQLAMDYLRTAASRGIPVDISGDLLNSQRRITQRSVQNDDYMDPFNTDKSASFTFLNSRTMEPIKAVKVRGVLPNDVTTPLYQTDGDGNVIIRWEGNHDHLKYIVTDDNREWSGPFKAGGLYPIKVVPTTPGGNGQPMPSGPAGVLTP